jgi:hypothetical protein
MFNWIDPEEDVMHRLSESLSGMGEQFFGEMGSYLPNLVAALLVLVIGWLFALLVAKMIVAALRRTTVDNRIAAWVRGGEGEAPEVEPVVGKIVFWFLMIFVLIAFFQALKLTVVTEPLRNLLDKILGAAPSVLWAAVLLLVAWLLATGLRLVVRKVFDRLNLDDRLGSEVTEDGAQHVPASQMLSETVYWLIFLLFLPAVLGALKLEGLLAPVQGMVEKLVGFLPNLFAAAAIFIVGWFFAKILRRIVTNLLAAVGLDSLGERVGLEKALGKQRLSGLVGLILYTFVLLMVIVLSLDALKLEKITRPASAMLDQILGAIPGLFGAGLILTIAFIVGRLVAGLVSNLLSAAGFDRLLGKLGFSWDPESGGASALVGHLVVVLVMLFASVEALGVLGFEQVGTLVSSFIVFFGNVLLGVVIFLLGLYLANLAATAVEASGQNPLLATAARVAITVLAAAMALRQMNVAENIIDLAFGLVLGAAAVAAAIAFGLGGRDLARQELERWSDNLRSRSSGDES